MYRSVFVSGAHKKFALGTTGGFGTKEEKIRLVFEESDWANLACWDPLGDHF